MPTKKLDEPRFVPCAHPEHEPPKHRVFEPGRYEHTCPGCGKRTTFTVPLICCYDEAARLSNSCDKEVWSS